MAERLMLWTRYREARVYVLPRYKLSFFLFLKTTHEILIEISLVVSEKKYFENADR